MTEQTPSVDLRPTRCCCRCCCHCCGRIMRWMEPTCYDLFSFRFWISLLFLVLLSFGETSSVGKKLLPKHTRTAGAGWPSSFTCSMERSAVIRMDRLRTKRATPILFASCSTSLYIPIGIIQSFARQ